MVSAGITHTVIIQKQVRLDTAVARGEHVSLVFPLGTR